MSSAQAGTADNRASAARAFARSLNILLKYVRLYGLEHKLAEAQFDTAWRELCAAMPPDAASGFLFGVSGSKLLLDGVPLETGPAERSFAQMLSAAGLASIYFSTQLTRADFGKLVEAFANSSSRPAGLAGELKRLLGENNGPIRVNEIRYVAQDGSGDPLPSQLAARALGSDSDKIKDWLSSPQKLLQLIAAAEGSENRGPAGERATASESGGSDAGSVTGGGARPLGQDDVQSVLRLLGQLGKMIPSDGIIDPSQLREQIQSSPVSVQKVLQSALTQMATEIPENSDPNLLVKIAEHLAIQFALERYEKGEVRVNAVRELLDRLGREIESLRKVLREHEEKMGRAGMIVESHTEILDREFWAAVPENGKRAVLTSPDAWCIPPRNVRDYVKQLLERRDLKMAAAILKNYIGGIRSADVEARRRTAMGLSELAELYVQVDPGLLRVSIQQTGEQLQVEPGMESQNLLSATLVRLTQEAGTHNDFVAMSDALECTDRLEKHRTELGRDVRCRIGVDSRVRRAVVEVLREPEIPEGFLQFTRREPRVAADELALQYSRSHLREHANRIVSLARGIGADVTARLLDTLQSRNAAEAVPTIGLLTYLDPRMVRECLSERLRQWSRTVHDSVVRQIGGGAVEERGPMLLEMLDLFDPAILPAVMDEIGSVTDPMATVRLLRLAEGDLPEGASPYVQVKAIEALARLRDTHAAPLLAQLLTARGLLTWKYPREVRLVAAQALMKLEPGFSVPTNTGLNVMELKLAPLEPEPAGQWVRQRRYPRITPERALPAFVQTARGRCGILIRSLSLGGGKGERDGRVNPGTEATLNVQLGLRNLCSRVLVRETGDNDIAFEIIHINHEDRSRLRRFLAEHQQYRVISRATAPTTATEPVR